MHLSALTCQQLAGQRLMVGFDGSRFSDTLKHYIENVKVGGLILFSQNLESPGQISDLCHAAQLFARQCGQPPLFIAIDQEGGVVEKDGYFRTGCRIGLSENCSI